MENKTYEIFTGKELEIAELIQQRRLQLLVHSRIYYELNQNLITDKKWDEWARELKTLQEHYPDIADRVVFSNVFKDWDASTGAFLPLDDEWVVKKASQLTTSKIISKKPKKKMEKIIKKKKSLF